MRKRINGICSVADCGKAAVARSLCPNHYYHDVRNGSPLTFQRARRGAALAWLRTTNFDTPDCVEWPFTMSHHGYGRVWIGGKHELAHRITCEYAHGPCPTGQEAAHVCGNRACVNPSHVRWATPAVNARDKRLHGRANGNKTRGRRPPISSDIVHACKHSVESGMSLARHFGISHSAISTWRRGLAREEVK